MDLNLTFLLVKDAELTAENYVVSVFWCCVGGPWHHCQILMGHLNFIAGCLLIPSLQHHVEL